MDDSGFLAASQGGRYANAAVLLILGLFVLFMSYAVAQRASLPVDVHESHDDEPHGDFHAHGSWGWLEGERTRASLAPRLRPLLVVVGTCLIVAAGIAALVSWL